MKGLFYPFILCGSLVGGCAGPQMHFDPAPAPAWISKETSQAGAAQLAAVGSAPATTHVQRDADLAVRDAKNQIAQMFESQVVARSSDWSLASLGGAEDGVRTVAAQSVEVRTRVQVEDVTVQASYRDEATRTHYARVVVDRKAWLQRLRSRLEDGLAQLQAQSQQAESALAEGKALSALEALIQGAEKGRTLEPDVVVGDLLDAKLGARAKLQEAKASLASLGRRLRQDYPFAVDVDGPQAAREKLLADLRSFLAGYGFAVAEGRPQAKAIRVQVKLGERALRNEQVGSRTEHVHAALGSLVVHDASGAEVARLAIELGNDQHTESDVDNDVAAKKAISLATDTVAARFRSAFREAYPLAE